MRQNERNQTKGTSDNEEITPPKREKDKKNKANATANASWFLFQVLFPGVLTPGDGVDLFKVDCLDYMKVKPITIMTLSMTTTTTATTTMTTRTTTETATTKMSATTTRRGIKTFLALFLAFAFRFQSEKQKREETVSLQH